VVTAALTVIPAPTITPIQAVITEETGFDTEIPQTTPGLISLDAFVKVSGTGGAGLRLRSSPGLQGTPQYLGLEDEIFKVESGPEEADGYTWWYLVAPFESNRKGWAAANYLEIVQEP
jgi:hypothetical protein